MFAPSIGSKNLVLCYFSVQQSHIMLKASFICQFESKVFWVSYKDVYHIFNPSETSTLGLRQLLESLFLFIVLTYIVTVSISALALVGEQRCSKGVQSFGL